MSDPALTPTDWAALVRAKSPTAAHGCIGEPVPCIGIVPVENNSLAGGAVAALHAGRRVIARLRQSIGGLERTAFKDFNDAHFLGLRADGPEQRFGRDGAGQANNEHGGDQALGKAHAGSKGPPAVVERTDGLIVSGGSVSNHG